MSFHLNNRNQYFIIKNVIYYSVMSCNMSRIGNVFSSFHRFRMTFTCSWIRS